MLEGMNARDVEVICRFVSGSSPTSPPFLSALSVWQTKGLEAE